MWNGGYITGCGYVDLLQQLKQKVASTNIHSTTEILEMVKDIDETSSLPFDAKRETHWMFTYQTIIDDKETFRVAIVDPSDNMEYRVLNKLTCTIWLDSDAAEKLISQVTSHIRPISDFENRDQAVQYYYDIMGQLFGIGSNESASVSNNFDMVVGYVDGYVTVFDT